MLLRLVAISFLIMFTNGCVVNHGDFTVLSNRLVDVKNFNPTQGQSLSVITGENVRRTVFIFSFGDYPTLESAIDDALIKGDGDLMINASIKSWGWYIPLIYGEEGWSVTGNVVNTRRDLPLY